MTIFQFHKISSTLTKTEEGVIERDNPLISLVPPARIELAAQGLGILCSIH